MTTQLALVFLLTITNTISCFSLLSQPNHHSNEERPTHLEFFNNLQCSKKGDKIEAIADLKKYLKFYGYLSNSHYELGSNDLYFDEHMETAIKTYQQNFNLNMTGILDHETLSLMSKPRCGVADVSNGTNFMQVIPHFAFFKKRQKWTKWPPSHYHLTYAFLTLPSDQAKDPIAQAFRTWELYSKFKFTLISDNKTADIKISFEEGIHGDKKPFDGPMGIIAHAFAPTDGRLHFDSGEKWVVGEEKDGFDLETVALHEIGHLLGLKHSSLPMAVMYPGVAINWTRRSLNEDDIQRITALYG